MNFFFLTLGWPSKSTKNEQTNRKRQFHQLRSSHPFRVSKPSCHACGPVLKSLQPYPYYETKTFLVSSPTSTLDPSCCNQRNTSWLILLSTFLCRTRKSKGHRLTHRKCKGIQMVSHLQQPIHVRLKLSWDGHAHLHPKKKPKKNQFTAHLWRFWVGKPSCHVLLYHIISSTLPFPDKNISTCQTGITPHPIPKRRTRTRTRTRKQTFKHLRTKSSKTNRTITDLRVQATHLISS